MKSLYRKLRHSLRPLREKYELFLGRFFPKKLANIRYREEYGKNIDWDNPKTIDEKINWMKFHYDTSQWTELTDKYRVRQYVTDRGLADILVPLYGKWDSVEDIDWESLPNEFVMKTNHGSGDVLICKDKSTLDKVYWTRRIDRWMHTDYSRLMGEPHYAAIKPCIIAEKLLDVTKQRGQSSSLIDYKIWSFDGKPMYVFCCFDRTDHSLDVITYDTHWNAHPEFSVNTSHVRLSEKRLPPPSSLNRMLEVAAILSKGHPEVRVDLYEIDGQLYFGEMTFTSASGVLSYFSEDFRLELGSYTQLPKN